MGYEKVQGDQLFDGNRLFGREKVLVQDGKGHKAAIIDLDDAGEEVRYVPGLITPGFVNTHCHLELSHLRNVVPQHTGLVPFLLDIVTKRDKYDEIKEQCIIAAEKEMRDDGIVAVGDICNTADTLRVKSASPIRFYNFVEVLSLTAARTKENFELYGGVLQQYLDSNMPGSVLTPHAPYTVSEEAFRLLNDLTENRTISVHNQETPAEDHLFQTGDSDFLRLFSFFGMASSPFPVSGKSSIRTWLPYFNKGQRIVLVHNTFMPEEDIDWALDHARRAGLDLVFCFCVNANLYIENALPPLARFMERGCHMVLGTDSYSSNTELKISHEIATIRERYPSIPAETVMQWATVNGAKAMGMELPWLTGRPLMQ